MPEDRLPIAYRDPLLMTLHNTSFHRKDGALSTEAMRRGCEKIQPIVTPNTSNTAASSLAYTSTFDTVCTASGAMSAALVVQYKGMVRVGGWIKDLTRVISFFKLIYNI